MILFFEMFKEKELYFEIAFYMEKKSSHINLIYVTYCHHLSGNFILSTELTTRSGLNA